MTDRIAEEGWAHPGVRTLLSELATVVGLRQTILTGKIFRTRCARFEPSDSIRTSTPRLVRTEPTTLIETDSCRSA